METKTSEARAAIAREWTRSSLTQEEFAGRHGIRPRTLREWCRKYAPPGEPVEVAREVLRAAIAKLQDVLDGLDAQAARRPADPKQMPSGKPALVAAEAPTPAERQPQPGHEAVEVAVEPEASAPAPVATVERPSRRKSFFAGFQ